MLLSIKILLALMAFCLTALQFVDKPAFGPSESGNSILTRVTRIGWIQFLIAFLMLGLMIANEILSEHAANADISSLSDKLETAQRSLDDTQTELSATTSVLNATFAEVGLLQGRVNLANEALERAEVVGTTASIDISNLNRFGGFGLLGSQVFSGRNSSERARKGDRIEWSLSCDNGFLPHASDLPDNTGCTVDRYGSLLAFADRVPIDTSYGSQRLIGTLSNDDDMIYQAPEGACVPYLEAMRERLCRIDLTFYRTAVSQMNLIAQERRNFPSIELSPSARLACDEYRRATGKTCEEFFDTQ